jgi:hypothetical protein
MLETEQKKIIYKYHLLQQSYYREYRLVLFFIAMPRIKL